MYWYTQPAALGHANGTALVPGSGGNTGGAAGGFVDTLTGTSTYQSGRWRASASAGQVSQVTKTFSAATTLSFRGRFYIPAAPSGGDGRLIGFWNGSTSSLRVEVRASDRRFVVYDASGYKYTSGAGVVAPIGATFDVALGGTVSDTAGKIRFAVYTANGGDTTTAAETPYSVDNANTGTAGWTDVRWPKVNSTPLWSPEWDETQLGDTQFTAWDPLPDTLPPVITLGADVTAEPGLACTLTATHTAGAAPSSWSWSQISGPTVTLSGSGNTRTFTAPSSLTGATVVIGCTPTGSSLTGAQDTITVTVPPHYGPWLCSTGGVLTNPVRPTAGVLASLAPFILGSAILGSSYLGGL